MNRNKLFVLVLALLMSMSALAACADKSKGKNTDTTAEAKGESETKETVMTPQYDYMGNNVAQYVTIDKSAYTDMNLTIPNYLRIEEGDVQDYINYLRMENRTAVNGTTELTDIEVRYGDDAFIYYKGFMDGEAFEGGSNWDDEKPYQLGIGSQSFIPGFEEGLIGIIPENTSKEDPYELHVTFPEDYGNEMAGKAATFQVVITHTIQYNVPEYTLDFVENTLKYEFKKDFYASDRARLDEFEAYVWEYLTLSYAEDMESAKSEALWTYLLSKATCTNLPKSDVDAYYNSYVSELQSIYDYYAASSVNGAEFVKLYPTVDDFVPVYMGLEEGADWKAEMKTRAEDVVKKKMIAHAIGETEGLETISEEEYDAQVQFWVDQYADYGMTSADVVASMGESALKELAFGEKIEAWLLARVTFTYEDGTPLDGSSVGETETEGETEGETTAETVSA